MACVDVVILVVTQLKKNLLGLKPTTMFKPDDLNGCVDEKRTEKSEA